MVARTVVSVAKGAVNHVMHMASAAREAVGQVARVVVNTVGTVAHAVGSAVKTAWNFCTGSARGAATCLAVAASVAMIASGVGAPEGVGLLATVLFTASSVASAVSFAQTGDPMDALGAIPGVGVLKDAEIGARLLPKAGYTVYRSVDAATGEIQYVGITKNLARRAAEHFREKGISIQPIPGLNNLSKADARGVEQALINKYGLGKNGGTLLNKINSIAESNPIYERAVARGRQLLGDAWYVP